MELNAALGQRNVFTRWAAKTNGAVWVAPVIARRGSEVGLVVTEHAVGLDAAIQDASGPDCRHAVELVTRLGSRTCLRYRCNRAGADGCDLLGSTLDALRPVLGAHGFVHSIRFDREGGHLRMLWPPGGPDAAAQIHEHLGQHGDQLERHGFRLLDVRDTTHALIDQSAGGPHLRGAELETMLVAMRYGYYESPRQCTMEDIAGHFGVSKSAIYHRIHAAEREAVRQLAAHAALLEKRPGDGSNGGGSL